VNSYFVYGGHLLSEVKFPSLPPRETTQADWIVSIGEPPPPQRTLRLRGSFELVPGWVLHLWDLAADGTRFQFGEGGTFDIGRRNGSHGVNITWYPGTYAEPQFIRLVMLGPVMALTLQDAGLLSLHGSAVAMGREVVAFIAPKYHGKSTLAASLVADGARLVTDDLVAIEPGPRPMVRPGDHGIRLFQDAADHLAPSIPGVLTPGPKTTVRDLPEASILRESVPLGAIYVLEPVEANVDLAVERELLPLVAAAAQVALRAALCDALVGPEAAATKLRWVTQIVQSVPVYRLRVARDFDRLPEVVRQIRHWHTSLRPSRVRA
jgi:hypothetical protein